MDIVPVFWGLDYHDEGIEVNVMNARGEIMASRHCPNHWRAVVPTNCRVAGAAIEACCGAADFAEDLIQHAGWSVDLAHPGFVARMKQNPGSLAAAAVANRWVRWLFHQMKTLAISA
jgi:transposase